MVVQNVWGETICQTSILDGTFGKRWSRTEYDTEQDERRNGSGRCFSKTRSTFLTRRAATRVQSITDRWGRHLRSGEPSRRFVTISIADDHDSTKKFSNAADDVTVEMVQVPDAKGQRRYLKKFFDATPVVPNHCCVEHK